MNILKGIRRVTLVLGVAAEGYATERAWAHHTYLQLGQRITASDKQLIKSLDCPSLDDGVHRQLYRTAEGNGFEVRLCFPSKGNESRGFYIEILGNDGKSVAYRVDTPDADAAMRAYVAEQFRLSPAELAYADQAYCDQRWAERREKLLDISIMLIIYVGAVTALSWGLSEFSRHFLR